MKKIKNYQLKLPSKISSAFYFKLNSLLRICLLLMIILNISCSKNKDENDSKNPNGVWQRYGSPYGYQTDLAVGNIPGEPANRVYMCEHPGSPTAGLYKGFINGNIITWDPVHNLPSAEFNIVGEERTLYFGVGLPSEAGKYKRGVWTNTCGELKYTPKNVFYQWTTTSNCSIPSHISIEFKHPDLPSNLNKNQVYGPMSTTKSIEIVISSNGSPNSSYIRLEEPPAGYKRIYTHSLMAFESSLGRCVFYGPLTHTDQPL